MINPVLGFTDKPDQVAIALGDMHCLVQNYIRKEDTNFFSSVKIGQERE